MTQQSSTFAAQTMTPRRGEWITVGTDEDAYRAGWKMAGEMQDHGLRYGEIGGEHGHIADMVAGEVLTAEDGAQFRIIAG